MRKKIYKITTALSIGFVFTIVSAYQAFAQDRMDMIESQLTELADSLAPGLNEKVNVSVSGVSLEEFIRALARSNNLNVDVDASLDQELINNFSDETVANILLFLCRQYDLDITFMGSILSIVPYAAPLPARQRYTPKNINVSYNKNEDLLSLDLRNDSLYLVVKKITQEVGKNIILSPEIGNQLVNVFIVELSLTEALTNFTYANALSVNQISDEVYIIEKGKLDGNSAGQSQSRNKNRNKNGENVFSVIVDNDASGNRVLTVDAFNIPIVDLIEFVSKEMYIDYFLFSDIKGTSTMSVSNLTYDNFLSYLLQGTDYTYKKQDHIYLIGHRNLEGLRHSKLLQLQYRSAEKIVELIPKEIKKGVQLQTFLELNSIILSGSKPQIDEIELFVRELDQLVPVILIDVIVVDVNKNRITSLGITAGVNNSIVTGGTIYPGVDFNIGSSTINNLIAILSGNGLWNLGNVTPDFYINLKALETDGIVNLRSTPKLATLNGHTASMSIGETDYYLQTTQNVIGTQNPQTVITDQYIPISANLSISILPVVSGNDQVTLDIKVEMTNFTGKSSPNAPPGSATRQFESLIRVKNNEMIMLGGLEEKEYSETGSGLPFLSRVPVLKWFFSSRTKTKSTGKLSIFIKPTIIY